MARLRLDERVRAAHAAALAKLEANHVGYFFDAEHFGNELDTYCNSRMRIVFIQDRGEDSVEVFPLDHPNDLFSLRYLIEMLAPEEKGGGFEGFETLPKVLEKVYALFDSKYYSCYRRAYSSYENCRIFFGLKMPDGTDVIDYKA